MELREIHRVFETLWDRYSKLRNKFPSEVQTENDELKEICQYTLGRITSTTNVDEEPYADLKEAVSAISQRKVRSPMENAVIGFFETIEETCSWTDADWSGKQSRPSSLAVLCDAIEFIFHAEPIAEGDWPKEYRELLIFNSNLKKRGFLEVCENLKTQKKTHSFDESEGAESNKNDGAKSVQNSSVPHGTSQQVNVNVETPQTAPPQVIKIKQRWGCLQWFGLVFVILIVLAILGALVGP